jgi:hypothetical protein
MPTYVMGKERPENELEFLTWHAQAIEAYAQLEQSLNGLFAHLLNTSPELASVVFFRVTSSYSRNVIIESLLGKRYPDRFDAYWSGVPNTPNKRGLIHLIKDLDKARNHIVHWHAVLNLTDEDGKPKASLELRRPNFWFDAISGSLRITDNDLKQFVAKATFAAQSINMFCVYLSGQVPADELQPWPDIFQKPCTYPPSDTHPLSRLR